jgi:hypothetical protein
MSIYIDEPVSRILSKLEESIKDMQKDIDRLEQTIQNDESPASVIDQMRGGCEDQISYCKDIRETLENIKGVL